LALRLRMLAVVLGALVDADGDCDDWPAAHSTVWAPRAPVAPDLPVFLIFRLPAARCRRPSRPP